MLMLCPVMATASELGHMAPTVVADEPLLAAITADNVAAVRQQLAAGADVHRRSDDRGRPPLLMAAKVGNPEVVRMLIDAGANINDQDRRGSTALHIAVHQGHLEVVKLLMERGANPRLENQKGHNPVQNAARRSAREPENPRRRDIATYLAGFEHNYTSRKGGEKSLIKRGEMPAPRIVETGSVLTPDDFRSLVRPALRSRGWKIEEENATRLRGSLRKYSETYKVEVRLDLDRIIIGFVPRFHTDRDRWLRFLENDIRDELDAPRYRGPTVTRSAPERPDP